LLGAPGSGPPAGPKSEIAANASSGDAVLRAVGLACPLDAGNLQMQLRNGNRADVHLNLPQGSTGDIQIIGRLKVHPELGRRPEITRQAKCCVRSNGTPLIDDLADPGWRYSQIPRQAVDTDAEIGHELLAKDFARMKGRAQKSFWHFGPPFSGNLSPRHHKHRRRAMRSRFDTDRRFGYCIVLRDCPSGTPIDFPEEWRDR